MSNSAHRMAFGVVVFAVVMTACGTGPKSTTPTDATTTTTAGATTTSSSIPATSTTSSSSSTVLATTSTLRASTTTKALGPVPATVKVVSSGPGGGSGEVELNWDTVANATGYRVLRASSQGGPFTVAVDVNVTTGTTTAAPDVTNVYSENATFLPRGSGTTLPTSPPRQMHYVQIITSGVQHRFYRIVAYNDAGDGPPSAIVCGSSPGEPTC